MNTIAAVLAALFLISWVVLCYRIVDGLLRLKSIDASLQELVSGQGSLVKLLSPGTAPPPVSGPRGICRYCGNESYGASACPECVANGGRRGIPTTCQKCGAQCPTRKDARAHCR